MERQMTHISEMLYVGLCSKIGTPTQVKIRRDVSTASENIRKPVEIYEGDRSMESGSGREGFRLKTSDMDYMLWFVNDIVICDLSQIPPYHPKQTLILMECNDTAPGFVKLQLLTITNKTRIRKSCVNVNDQMCISSSLYREECQYQAKSHPLSQTATQHGPCTSGSAYQIQFDLDDCFSCQHWPPPVYPWITRCQRKGWPSPQVLQDIISGGCHFVAIGSGRSTSLQQCDTEWRMSFSQAKYKLVYSMNHTQFLCYGLLKIFLKEVLDVGTKQLLCSYFMKTTLFWKTQENSIPHWCPQNILNCVWHCFKYLTQCVFKGEFPNFFIPQNNMFLNKIHSTAQRNLFLHLLNLYNMGFSCLLLSPSLFQMLSIVILNPQLQVCTDENSMISEVQLDMEVFKEIHANIPFFSGTDFDKCLRLMESINDIMKFSSFSQSELVTLHAVKTTSLQHISFHLDKSSEDHNTHTTDTNRPLDMLISAAESGFISDNLYVAMYLYKKYKYMEALYYIEKTKQKLSQPYVLDPWTNLVIRDRYIEAVGGKSLLDKVRMAVSSVIYLDQICLIDEVKLEIHVNKRNGSNSISVPPLVVANMLSFLCHHHLGDSLKSRQSLDDLHTLLLYDEGQYINPQDRHISWQILGICKQCHGDLEDALLSYHESPKHPFHTIQKASHARIQNILLKCSDNSANKMSQ